MNRTGLAITRTFALALFALWAVLPALAQDKPETPKPTETEKPAEPAKAEGTKPVQDGHDRPTTYPTIRMGPGDGAKGAAATEADKAKQTIHAYLIDVSDAMGASITVNDREYTRFDLLVSAMGTSLDGFAARSNMRFNIVTLGKVQDFAAGAEPLPFNAENVKRAKDWLAKLECKGTGDIYALLKAVFDKAPDSVSLLVGSMPAKPADVSDEELAKHESVAAFVLAQVKAWRAAGKMTKLDITGIGLTQKENKFYRDLAEATGGGFLKGS